MKIKIAVIVVLLTLTIFIGGKIIYAQTTNCQPTGNVDCNGVVDQNDFLLIIREYAKDTLIYDLNSDGKINGTDIVYAVRNFGQLAPTPTTSLPSITPTPSGPTPTPYTGQGFVVDHTSIDLFDRIPDRYIIAAENLRLLFSDRSVGQNTNEGFTCLAYSSDEDAPTSCKRYTHTNPLYGSPQSEVNWSRPGGYNRNNWTFEFRGGNFSELTQDFVTSLGPQYINSKDVFYYQFSYLNIDSTDTIANPTTGFFADRLTTNTIYGIADYEAFIAQHPDKTFIFITTSLSRLSGTQVATDFNNQMRQYARNNNKILFDFADIESHDPSGNACYDTRDGNCYCARPGTDNPQCEDHDQFSPGTCLDDPTENPNDGLNIPAICQHYTTEPVGGHLYDVAKIRIVKAFWVLMARVAGWDGVSQ